MGPACSVNGRSDVESLKGIILEHQRCLSDYPTLCRLAGEVGVAKWVCDLFAMTCSYFDKTGQKMHVEQIPVGEYRND
jgi:uncharacterized protein YbcV (DUF1398 family)